MLILLTTFEKGNIMEENFVPDNVRSRLILSGLSELDKHGVVDFSLRRVAIDAGVSCAAPYRHFKDKDELIGAIIAYVMEGWTVLCDQMRSIYSHDSKACVVELAVAGLRFWIGNGNFRTVIMSSDIIDRGCSGMKLFDDPVADAVREYCNACGRSDSDILVFKVLSMLYGAVMLACGGYETPDRAAENLRYAISEVL